MSKYVTNVLLPTLIAVSLYASGCSSKKKPVKETWTVMGTFSSISVSAGDAGNLKKYASVAEDAMGEIESTMSLFKGDSEISLLNQSAGKEAVSVSGHVNEVLKLAWKYAELSDGSFDATVAPLVQLWGFSGGQTPDKRSNRASPRSATSGLRSTWERTPSTCQRG